MTLNLQEDALLVLIWYQWGHCSWESSNCWIPFLNPRSYEWLLLVKNISSHPLLPWWISCNEKISTARRGRRVDGMHAFGNCLEITGTWSISKHQDISTCLENVHLYLKVIRNLLHILLTVNVNATVWSMLTFCGARLSSDVWNLSFPRRDMGPRVFHDRHCSIRNHILKSLKLTQAWRSSQEGGHSENLSIGMDNCIVRHCWTCLGNCAKCLFEGGHQPCF